MEFCTYTDFISLLTTNASPCHIPDMLTSRLGTLSVENLYALLGAVLVLLGGTIWGPREPRGLKDLAQFPKYYNNCSKMAWYQGSIPHTDQYE